MPLARRKVTVGKKSLRSTLSTTWAPVWAAALVAMDRPARKPWLAPWTGSRSTTLRRIQRCAALSLGSGAQMARGVPSRLGMVKRR